MHCTVLLQDFANASEHTHFVVVSRLVRPVAEHPDELFDGARPHCF